VRRVGEEVEDRPEVVDESATGPKVRSSRHAPETLVGIDAIEGMWCTPVHTLERRAGQ
jgi:hypothetical protein